jgi:hypothetical protein
MEPRKIVDSSNDTILLAVKMASLSNLAYDAFTDKLQREKNEISKDPWVKALGVFDHKFITEKKGNQNGEDDWAATQAVVGKISLVINGLVGTYPFVAFRGTQSKDDLLNDINIVVTSTIFSHETDDKKLSCGKTYKDKLIALRKEGLFDEVVRLIKETNSSGLLVTGHSLGAALSALFCTEFFHDDDRANLLIDKPIRIVTFGSPKIFDIDSCKSFFH